MAQTTPLELRPVGVDRLEGVLPDVELAIAAEVIADIDKLKRRRNAVVMAHN